MIPPQGFLGSGQNTLAALLDHPLPEPFVASYADLIRRGKPIGVNSQITGSLVVNLTIPNRYFLVTIRQLGCHGTALVDKVF